MFFEFSGRFSDLVKSGPGKRLWSVYVFVILCPLERIVRERVQFPSALVDRHDRVHSISHVEVVFIDAVSDSEPKMLARYALAEI
jgi:hypothetical protein